jgi:hypothetical protein
MIKLHAGLLALLVAIPDAAVAQESATGVLSNAIAAFSYNQEKEEHWN